MENFSIRSFILGVVAVLLFQKYVADTAIGSAVVEIVQIVWSMITGMFKAVVM